MRSKSLLVLISLFLVTVLTGCSVDTRVLSVATNNPFTSAVVSDTANKSQESTVAVDTVTVGEMAAYLQNKSEHYPYSDEFIERYQQNGGGYIDNAKKAGLLVDRQQHEPNQKWHFFDSWLAETLADTPDIMEQDAKSRVYTKLLCPELLLWIYEACEVDPAKVKKAMDVAMEGKASGTSVSTIAKNMRSCVAWEDLLLCFQNKVSATGVTLSADNLNIEVGGQDAQLVASVTPANANEVASWTVVEGADNISIAPNGNKATVHAVKEGSAKIRVSYNANVFADCLVSIVDNRAPAIESLPTNLTLRVGKTSTLTPTLNKGEDTFTFLSQDDNVATVSADGLVTAVAVGNTNIVVACAKTPQLTATVAITVLDNSATVTSIYTIADDLGTGKRPIQFETTADVFAALTLVGDGLGNIDSISDIQYIYGGGYGGSGETLWYLGSMLKFGTGSVNGSITFELTGLVNYVKITGYVAGSTCTIRVGDSASTDWTDGVADYKTTKYDCADMNVANKQNTESGSTSTILVNFAETSSVTIATVNTSSSSKKPLYITSIEFGYSDIAE